MGLFDGGGDFLSGLFQSGDIAGAGGLSLDAGAVPNMVPPDLAMPAFSLPDVGTSGLNVPFGGVSAGQGAPAGGNWWDALAGVAKQAVPFAQLGLTGLGIGAGIQNMNTGAQQFDLLKQAQKQQQQTAAPAAAAGSELTAAGTSALLGGPLPPELESQVQQKVAEMRAQIRSYFANSNITDSSMMAEYEGWISMQEQALRSQMAQNLLQSGYTGVATALGPSSALERSSLATQGGINQTLAGANQAIAQLTGAAGPQRPDQQNA